jgi:hypothetical protein
VFLKLLMFPLALGSMSRTRQLVERDAASAGGNLLGREMRKTFTDQERADIARGWAASGLPQDLYAARYTVTGRCLRSWLRTYAPLQPPLQRVESIILEMMARLQFVLDDARAQQAAQEGRAEGGATDPEAMMVAPRVVVEELLRLGRRGVGAVGEDQAGVAEDQAEPEPRPKQGAAHGRESVAVPEDRAGRAPRSARKGFFSDFQ